MDMTQVLNVVYVAIRVILFAVNVCDKKIVTSCIFLCG